MAKRGLKPADLGKIPVEVGLMNEDGYPHQGLIDYIAPMVDPTTGTLMVRGLLANTDRALLPGMFVRIRVPLALEQGEALLVPNIALGADQSGTYVLVVDKDNVVEQRTVTTGQLVGKLRVIETGIAADDLVVVDGNQKAIPGETVAPQPTSITAEGNATPGKS
jgi:RND family efflux transporter MFP subunit